MHLALCLFIIWMQLVGSCKLQELEIWSRTRLGQLSSKGYGRDSCGALAGNRSQIVDSSLGIKLFLFQNDEHELLADWLQYHAHLFGISNLVVIDHRSRDATTCALLALYKQCGTRIVTYAGNFEDKHAKLSEAMQNYAQTMLIPLDADEFVVLVDHNVTANKKLTYEPEAILHAVSSLPIDGRKYKFAGNGGIRYESDVCNTTLHHPGGEGGAAYRRVLQNGYTALLEHESHDPRSKTFYFSDGFISTDQGNHFGKVRHDHGRVNIDKAVMGNFSKFFVHTDLALLHLLVPSFDGAKKKVLRGADAYGFTDETNCSAVVIGGGYCQPAKIYRHDLSEAKARYLSACQRRSTDSYSTASFSDWFRTYSLSLEELIGNDYPGRPQTPWWQVWNPLTGWA